MADYDLGIEKTYNIKKTVKKELILNDKVINYLFDKIKNDNQKRHFVLRVDYDGYKEITKDIIKQLIDKGNIDKEVIVELDDYPEYDNMPFAITHASPYNHRWEGDYDEDAYEDWKVDTYSLTDFFYEDPWQREPYYAEHPEKFDFKEEVVEYSNEELEDTRYYL